MRIKIVKIVNPSMFVRVLYELFFLNIFFDERRITRGNDRSRLLLREYTVAFLKGRNNVVSCLGFKISRILVRRCAPRIFSQQHTRDTKSSHEYNRTK